METALRESAETEDVLGTHSGSDHLEESLEVSTDTDTTTDTDTSLVVGYQQSFTEPSFDESEATSEVKTSRDKVVWKQTSIDLEKAAQELQSGVLSKQGLLGNCWLVSSIISLLSSRPETIREIIEPGSGEVPQTFKISLQVADTSQGARRAVPKGETVDIVVDTALPHIGGRLAFGGRQGKAPPTEVDKLVALIEKAVAAQFGSYDLVKSGHPVAALAILTGKQASSINLAGSQGPDQLRTLGRAWGTTPMTALISGKRKDPSRASWEDHAMVLKSVSPSGVEVYDQAVGTTLTVKNKALLASDKKPIEQDGRLWKFSEITSIAWT